MTPECPHCDAYRIHAAQKEAALRQAERENEACRKEIMALNDELLRKDALLEESRDAVRLVGESAKTIKALRVALEQATKQNIRLAKALT